jgi:CheY-like chemotaxis protein
MAFEIVETGIGMTAAQISRLFEEFSQGEDAVSPQYQGTGLGLALSQKICRMMGGEITVASERGRGSTFTVRLPVTVRAPAADESPKTGADRPLRPAGTVLVIDDDAAARDLMRRFLIADGFTVRVAGDGDEGLRLADELRPDVITLDVMMPGRDGWSVLAALKASPELADIPVVMVSIVGERNLGFALGATDYLTKPVDRTRLTTVLRKHCQGRFRALVVDDDASLRRQTRRALELEGCSVVEAANGVAAMERLREEAPAVIFLDLVMPEMDGFEFLAAIQEHEEWRGIPVVVFAPEGLSGEERQRLGGQVERVLERSAFSPEKLLREVRALVVPPGRERYDG